MDKIHYALTNLRLILNGLTRGIELSILDRGFGEQSDHQFVFTQLQVRLGW